MIEYSTLKNDKLIGKCVECNLKIQCDPDDARPYKNLNYYINCPNCGNIKELKWAGKFKLTTDMIFLFAFSPMFAVIIFGVWYVAYAFFKMILFG